MQGPAEGFKTTGVMTYKKIKEIFKRFKVEYFHVHL